MVRPLEFFDANVMAGRPRVAPDPIPWESRPLARLLDEFGIAEALVRHVGGKEVDANWGNERVLAATREDARLHPVWTAMPAGTGEVPPPDAFCDRMRQNGVRVAAVFPTSHNWSLADWCAGPLMAEFEARKVPVLLDQDEAGWPAIAAVLAAHPGLRLILIGGTYRNSRFLYPLFARHRHLYLEISGWQQHRALESAATTGHAGHLLFGSRLPLYTPGSALAAVTYADLSDADRRRIAGGTLRRLIEEAQP